MIHIEHLCWPEHGTTGIASHSARNETRLVSCPTRVSRCGRVRELGLGVALASRLRRVSGSQGSCATASALAGMQYPAGVLVTRYRKRS